MHNTVDESCDKFKSGPMFLISNIMLFLNCDKRIIICQKKTNHFIISFLGFLILMSFFPFIAGLIELKNFVDYSRQVVGLR